MKHFSYEIKEGDLLPVVLKKDGKYVGRFETLEDAKKYASEMKKC